MPCRTAEFLPELIFSFFRAILLLMYGKLNWINYLLNDSSGHNSLIRLYYEYLRSSCPSLPSCIRPHQCPLSMFSPPERWLDQHCTSDPHCLPLQPGSGSSYAGFHYNAGPPGLGSGHLWHPGSHKPVCLPRVLLQHLDHHLDSQIDSAVKRGRDWG